MFGMYEQAYDSNMLLKGKGRFQASCRVRRQVLLIFMQQVKIYIANNESTNEPRHKKTCVCHMRI